MQKNKKGFTLAELLVVVAIIAVLVAIAIPIFTNQLEKSREATDAANIRSQYAEVMTDGITNGTGDINTDHSKYAAIELKQTKNGWQTTDLGNNLNSLFGTHIEGEGPNKGGIAWVSYDSKNDCAVLHYEGGSGSSGGNTGGSGSGTGTGTGTGGNTGSGSGGDNTPSNSLDSKLNNSAITWSNSIKSIVEGNVYSYEGKFYIAVTSNNNLDPSAKKPKDGWSQAYYCELTGKVFSLNDFDSQRNDVNAGDACRDGDNYFIYKDGGNITDGPIRSSWQWLKMN